MTPRATMRLQLNKEFSFDHAAEAVPYMARLGISHVYASPIATARPGSTHGYDCIDPTRINPELGGEESFDAFVSTLQRHGLGLIVDIVPNHMAASVDNPWWMDVLQHGRNSRFANFFDIDWDSEDPSLVGKVLLPVLGSPLAVAIDRGELIPERADDGWWGLGYHDLHLPLDRDVGSPGPIADIDRLLERQHYRLAWWRSANDRINWRRFFEINDLVSLRIEDDAVFDAVHELVIRLYREQAIQGVRIDHVDGLFDPGSYCRKLRQRLDPNAPDRPYLLVEKILLGDENLETTWGCNGTTGYDFMNQVSAVLHDPAAEAVLDGLWSRTSGRSPSFAPEEMQARREIVARSFGAQLEACTAAFHALSGIDRHGAELSRPVLRRIITELLVHFPVYRFYGKRDARSDDEMHAIAAAEAAARGTVQVTDRWALDIVAGWLKGPWHGDEQDARLYDRAMARFQQLSAPIAAKAVEDTAFYRYGRLISRNDVGFDAGKLAETPEQFHERSERRRSATPNAMLATSSHDHKRGEDVRARLAVLSEIASVWSETLAGWITRIRPLRRDGKPSDGDIAILLQMVVGSWPLDLDRADKKGRDIFAARLVRWQEKALREAKLHSDWAEPDEAYEQAAWTLVTRLIVDNECPELLDDIVDFVHRIAAAGALNGLAQVTLKLTSPGVPDFYQGTDYWDLSMVDPDNRTAVDFVIRDRSLSSRPASLLDRWRDGTVKQALIARLLGLRAAVPHLFEKGTYRPLYAEGAHAYRLIAFERYHEDGAIIVVVPRLPFGLLQSSPTPAIPSGAWLDTTMSIQSRKPMTDAITGLPLEHGNTVRIGDLLKHFPIACLSTHQL